MKITSAGVPVEVIDFEGYMNQLDNTSAGIKDRCDYLLLDGTPNHTKIAFCDLTCSEEKYVNPNDGKYPQGKRAKAFSQMKKSLECLLEEPLFAHYILTFPEKIGLFGWRDYAVPVNVQPKRGNAVSNMLAFINSPSAKCGTLSYNVPVIGHGFKFVQVKYPTIYRW